MNPLLNATTSVYEDDDSPFPRTTTAPEETEITCPGTLDPQNFTACCYDVLDDVDNEEHQDEDDEEDVEKTGSGDGKLATTSTSTTTVNPTAGGAKLRHPRCCAPKEPQQNFLDWVLGLDPR